MILIYLLFIYTNKQTPTLFCQSINSRLIIVYIHKYYIHSFSHSFIFFMNEWIIFLSLFYFNLLNCFHIKMQRKWKRKDKCLFIFMVGPILFLISKGKRKFCCKKMLYYLYLTNLNLDLDSFTHDQSHGLFMIFYIKNLCRKWRPKLT
jgi:hypothetical protein